MRLEDGGSSGSAGAHWEKTFVYNEYMMGQYIPNMYVSKLTLSFFQDMGYYLPNYDMAWELYYGLN